MYMTLTLKENFISEYNQINKKYLLFLVATIN